MKILSVTDYNDLNVRAGGIWGVLEQREERRYNYPLKLSTPYCSTCPYWIHGTGSRRMSSCAVFGHAIGLRYYRCVAENI